MKCALAPDLRAQVFGEPVWEQIDKRPRPEGKTIHQFYDEIYQELFGKKPHEQ
jgi:hypothetical protein